MTEFEFAERKSRVNAAKHGIDFVAAQELWLDDDLLEVPRAHGRQGALPHGGRHRGHALVRGHHVSSAAYQVGVGPPVASKRGDGL